MTVKEEDVDIDLINTLLDEGHTIVYEERWVPNID